MLEAKDICVVNASNPVHLEHESDVYVDHRDGKFFDGDIILKEVRSWHSLSACLQTEFFVYPKDKYEGCFNYKGIILLVNRNLEHVMPLLKKLKLLRKKIFVGFHENGRDFTLFPNERGKDWLKQFVGLINMADGQWNVILNWSSAFAGFHDKPIINCIHAAPYEEWKHSFTVAPEKREGVLLATRTLNQRLDRNTIIAMGCLQKLCKDINTMFTYLDEDNFGEDYFKKDLKLSCMNYIKGPLKYNDWLKLIAKHKVVSHYDTTHSLSQIALDAALVDVMCVGGNGDNQYITSTSSDCLDSLYGLTFNFHKWCNPRPDNLSVYNNCLFDLKFRTSFESICGIILDAFNGN